MMKAVFTTLLLTFSLTSSVVSDIIQDKEIEWAYKYIEDNVENIERPEYMPNGFKTNFNGDTAYVGYALRNNKHHFDWFTEIVPLGGTILVRDDWTFGSIEHRSTLVHEMCHILDMKTARGCRCDPYKIQYKFLVDNGYSPAQIGLVYLWNYHDWSRPCYLKMAKTTNGDSSKSKDN